MQTVILCNKIIPTLSPLCENSPTATLEILGKSLLERQLESLSESGFSEVTVVTGEQGGELLRLTELLKEKFSIRIFSSDKSDPAVLRRVWLGGDMLVVGCENLPMCDVNELLKIHKKTNSPLTVSVKCTDKNPFELVQKPSTDFSHNGVYIVSEEVVACLPLETRLESMEELARLNPNAVGVPDNSGMFRIKSPADFVLANKLVLENAVDGEEKRYEMSQGFFNRTGKFLHGVTIIPPVYVGKNVTVGRGTVLDSGTILSDNVSVGEGCYLKGAIAGRNSVIMDKTSLDGAIICKGAELMKGAVREKMSIIGTKTAVGENATVKQGVKIWGGKKISPSVTVTEDVYNTNDGEIVFDDEGAITDLCGFFTPDFAARLGMAIASALDEDEKTVVSYVGKEPAKHLANAMTAGICSVGITSYLLGNASKGELLFAMNHTDATLGIEITSDFKTAVRVFSKGGLKISNALEKQIEENLNFRLFRFRHSENYGEIISGQAFCELYADMLEKQLPKRFKGLNVRVKTTDEKIAKLADRIFLPRNDVNGEAITLHINSAGEGVCAYSEKTGYVFREKLTLIALKNRLLEGADVSLPENFPDVAETVSEELEGGVVRYNLISDDVSDKAQRKIAAEPQNLFVNDPLSLCVKVVSTMIKDGLSLKKLVSQLPEFSVSQRFVAVGAAEKGITSTKSYKNESDGSRAVIKPVKNGKGVIIYAQAEKSEIAGSLCDEIERKLKSVDFFDE